MLTYYHLWKMNPTEARPYRIPREGMRGQGDFGTHRRIVRKWVRRYEGQGESGFESLPLTSESQSTRLDPQLERLILRFRDSSGFGPQRLHYWLNAFMLDDGVALLGGGSEVYRYYIGLQALHGY